jgi:glycosyltransferase involved in cell wall biosynthesis
MPRILRIINRFNLGGPTYNASYLTKYLAPEFKTFLLGGQKDDSEENSEYIVHNLGLIPVIIPEMRRTINPLRDLAALSRIKSIIKEFKPDIVHTHASKAGALGRRAAHSMGVPIIIHTFHGHVFDSYFSGPRSAVYQSIERNLAKKTTKIIALSEAQKYDLVDKYKICPEEKVQIIPLGFDLTRFRENIEDKRNQFRNNYFVEDDEIAIGIVGRLVPIKNHNLFLEGLKYVIENSKKKIRAFIVGDGEDKNSLIQRCKDLQLDYVDITEEKRKALITFTSWIKHVDYVYAGMDIIALTSLSEGTPVSLIEAQATGKSIITTNVGGIENIVIPGKTALLTDNNNALEFGKNLLNLVENENLRKEFSENGWDFVREKFHYTRLISDMKQLYYKLLEDTKHNVK